VASGKLLPGIGKHDGGLNCVALSPDERSLAVVTMGGSLYLWELATGQERLITKNAGCLLLRLLEHRAINGAAQAEGIYVSESCCPRTAPRVPQSLLMARPAEDSLNLGLLTGLFAVRSEQSAPWKTRHRAWLSADSRESRDLPYIRRNGTYKEERNPAHFKMAGSVSFLLPAAATILFP